MNSGSMEKRVRANGRVMAGSFPRRLLFRARCTHEVMRHATSVGKVPSIDAERLNQRSGGFEKLRQLFRGLAVVDRRGMDFDVGESEAFEHGADLGRRADIFVFVVGLARESPLE